jgi:hypothetical protein
MIIMKESYLSNRKIICSLQELLGTIIPSEQVSVPPILDIQDPLPAPSIFACASSTGAGESDDDDGAIAVGDIGVDSLNALLESVCDKPEEGLTQNLFRQIKYEEKDALLIPGLLLSYDCSLILMKL